MFDEPAEKFVQLSAFGRRERREQFDHRRIGGAIGGIEPLPSARRDVHGIAAPIPLILTPLRQTLPLQLIDDVDHRRLVQLQPVDQRALTERPHLGQTAEYPEVTQLELLFPQCTIRRRARIAVRQIELTADLGAELLRSLLHRQTISDDRSSEFR